MQQSTILDEIVALKRDEVASRKAQVSLTDLEDAIAGQPRPLNMSGALLGDRVRLIGEIKKASPSKGLLCPDFDPSRLASTYVENGAAAISVLTDPRFQGCLEHMSEVKAVTSSHGTPTLRKDFVFDSYQVYESRSWGADAILLIVAILDPAQLKELIGLARHFWMQCLVEVHTPEEMGTALDAGAEIIGINNRDLRTFHTDIDVTRKLAGQVPRGKVIVSESGISTAEHIRELKGMKVNAALVGEAIVTAPDVGAKVRELAG
ncbi:MAG: indole-3-glycerol phosphate synthase TrpC [Dehalococcoidia bacterium]|nr:indole-3-glycerol phosphate synthase TrpC [Dehalococcoidia bacterium]